MSSSVGRRREAKAARRKKILAERRRHAGPDAAGSLASRVERLARAPIHRCVLQKDLFESGIGAMCLVRGTHATGLTMAAFLLDVFCLGVKDVTLRTIEHSGLEDYFAAMAAEAAPFDDVEPAYARKLLRDLVAYARSIGFEPPREYKAAEQLFGDVSADASDACFEFGCDGRPCYLPGPSETPAQVRRRLEQLRRAVGEDGFDFYDGDEEEEDADDPALFDGNEALEGYDPDTAPDTREWLELGEDERIWRVERFHRRAGVQTENDTVHAFLHVIVENQVALNDPPAVADAVRRLMEEGGDRHDAVHAVAAVFLACFPDDEAHAGPFPIEAYSAELQRLTIKSWRAQMEALAEGEKP